MTYEKCKPLDNDDRRFWVIGIAFADDESDETVKTVVSEVLSMDTLVPGLMTAKAVYRKVVRFHDEKYVLERLISMLIGKSIIYKSPKSNYKITRHSENTYTIMSDF